MKNKIVLILAFAFLGLSLTSCSNKIGFSTDVRNRVVSKNIPLTKLQYYVDRDVVLKRTITTGETKVSSGTVKVENGKQVHIIKLKKGTPGICTQVYPDKLAISFEDGANKNLLFGFPQFGNSTNSYVLQVLETDKNQMGKVNYDGKIYYVQPEGLKAKIKIKKSSDTNVKVKKQTMKGRKVN